MSPYFICHPPFLPIVSVQSAAVSMHKTTGIFSFLKGLIVLLVMADGELVALQGALFPSHKQRDRVPSYDLFTARTK